MEAVIRSKEANLQAIFVKQLDKEGSDSSKGLLMQRNTIYDVVEESFDHLQLRALHNDDQIYNL